VLQAALTASSWYGSQDQKKARGLGLLRIQPGNWGTIRKRNKAQGCCGPSPKVQQVTTSHRRYLWDRPIANIPREWKPKVLKRIPGVETGSGGGTWETRSVMTMVASVRAKPAIFSHFCRHLSQPCVTFPMAKLWTSSYGKVRAKQVTSCPLLKGPKGLSRDERSGPGVAAHHTGQLGNHPIKE